jgi:predicted  nucleic acid-binding Zn-ribbon protein
MQLLVDIPSPVAAAAAAASIGEGKAMADDNTSELLAAINANLAAFRMEVQNALAPVRVSLAALQQGISPMQTALSALQQGVTPMQAALSALQQNVAPMRAQLDGMPLLHRNLTTTQNDVRMLASAFNDFALTNVTKGEIEVLHTELNRVQAENATLAVRMETAERRIGELQEAINQRTADLKTFIDSVTARERAGQTPLTPP